MPRVIEYLCKQCGRKRLESNHWWELTDVMPAYLPPMVPRALMLRPFTGANDAEYFCGRACAYKEIEAWMESQSAAAPAGELTIAGLLNVRRPAGGSR